MLVGVNMNLRRERKFMNLKIEMGQMDKIGQIELVPWLQRTVNTRN